MTTLQATHSQLDVGPAAENIHLKNFENLEEEASDVETSLTNTDPQYTSVGSGN